MTYLSDPQRVELALPAHLFYGLSLCDVFKLDPARADEPGAKEKGEREVADLQSLLQLAAVEPLADLMPKKRASLGRRIDRLARETMGEYDQASGLKIALMLYYWLEDLLARGVLICHEDSAFGVAISRLFAMFNHGFDLQAVDASAQKQARRLIEKFQAEGFYRQ